MERREYLRACTPGDSGVVTPVPTAIARALADLSRFTLRILTREAVLVNVIILVAQGFEKCKNKCDTFPFIL